MAASNEPLLDQAINKGETLQTFAVRIRGTVQGVGFRPTVWRLAQHNGINGEVLNDSEGVLITVSSSKHQLDHFLQHIQKEKPPLAQIDTIEVKPVDRYTPFSDFRISQSSHGANHAQVTPDAVICEACRTEILNPNERRYYYPFTNCTHCGPRLTIVKSIPYDRSNTSMSDFPMCKLCRAEYLNPGDRRFHAQPIACSDCGPSIWLQSLNHKPITGHHEAIEATRTQLMQGAIVAIRGLGGYHLACDASNEAAVARLRQRKRRYAKPFAMMADNLDIIRRYCTINSEEETQLRNAQAPIVLLNAHQKQRLANSIVPSQVSDATVYGFMLPYTPLHALILNGLQQPLVMTSGNVSDEPQIIDNITAKQTLFDIADAILFHDRDIINRIDDSVVRHIAGKPRLMRRARGYAPKAIPLPRGFDNAPDLLAYGGELKSTFCLIKDNAAIVSQHQGDLENTSTYDDYQKNLSLYKTLYAHTPRLLAADLHPEYLSSKLAKQSAQTQQLSLIEVQHHHAHIASCLAENAYPLDAAKVLGVALDGLGYGEDHTFWGGEFLLADYYGYTRMGSFKPIPMIGGTQAIIEPWRSSYAHINTSIGWPEFEQSFSKLDLYRYLQTKPLATIKQMLKHKLNVPLASSCGRLFDAVAAAMGLYRDRVDNEGQGAIELEMLVDQALLLSDQPGYPFAIQTKQSNIPLIESKPMWHALLHDLEQKTALSTMATRFHKGLARAIVAMITHIASTCRDKQIDFDTVALSGGCFQNKVLLESVIALIELSGWRCLTQATLPSNDGGLSLGQALIAAAQTIRTQPSRRTTCA